MHSEDIRLNHRYVAQLGSGAGETIVKVTQHPSGRFRTFAVVNKRTGQECRVTAERIRRPVHKGEAIVARNSVGGGGIPAGASASNKVANDPAVQIVTALATKQSSFSELRMKLQQFSAATLSEELYSLKTKGQIALDRHTDPGVPRWYLPNVPYQRESQHFAN